MNDSHEIKINMEETKNEYITTLKHDDIRRNASMPNVQAANVPSPMKSHIPFVLKPPLIVDNYSDNMNVIDLYGTENIDNNDTQSIDTHNLSVFTDHNDSASTDMGSPTTIQRQSAYVRNDPAHFDRYGFRKQNNYISEEEYDIWWNDYSKYCIKRKKKWESYLTKSGLPLNNDTPTNFPPNCDKLKRYARKGIPAEWRGSAWWHFARGEEKLNKNKGLYDKLLLKVKNKQFSKEAKNSKNNDFEIIERDLGRTFPDNIHFHKESFQKEEPVMIKSLRRILLAFSIYDTTIGYCQSMNFIAGLLLLFMDEEKAFWMLVIITKKYLPGVHSINLEGVNIDQGVLILCIKEYLPELWEQIELSYIRSNHQDNIMNPENKVTLQNYFNKEEYLYKLPPITLTTASWFMSCFISSVPIETTLRIWDCLFYEKSHFLFKASLAILKLSEEELLENDNSTRKFLMSTLSLATNASTDSITLINNNKPKNYKDNQDDYDILMFQVIQSFPRKLLDPNELFDKVLFKNKFLLNKLTQEEIDLRRKYVSIQRNKLKHFDETVIEKSPKLNQSNCMMANNNGKNTGLYNKEYSISSELVDETLSSEVNDFKRTNLNSVNWNNSIKERVRNMKQNK